MSGLNNIKRIIKEGDEDLFFIPSLKFVNDDWNTLVQFLEYEGFPKWHLGGDLDLKHRKDITSLYNLVRVDGYVDLTDCSNLDSLGSLERVDGWLSLERTTMKSLGNLNYVGFFLFIKDSVIFRKYREDEIRKMLNPDVRIIYDY